MSKVTTLNPIGTIHSPFSENDQVPIQAARSEAIGNVDVLDGTPLLDIKPFDPDFDAPQDVRTGWYEHRSNK